MIQNKEIEDNNEYLVCLIYVDQVDDIHEWSIITGQTETYEFLKEVIIESGMIDLGNSFIIGPNATLKNKQSVYNFIRYIKNIHDHDDDVEFDIDDYV